MIVGCSGTFGDTRKSLRLGRADSALARRSRRCQEMLLGLYSIRRMRFPITVLY